MSAWAFARPLSRSPNLEPAQWLQGAPAPLLLSTHHHDVSACPACAIRAIGSLRIGHTAIPSPRPPRGPYGSIPCPTGRASRSWRRPAIATACFLAAGVEDLLLKDELIAKGPIDRLVAPIVCQRRHPRGARCADDARDATAENAGKCPKPFWRLPFQSGAIDAGGVHIDHDFAAPCPPISANPQLATPPARRASPYRHLSRACLDPMRGSSFCVKATPSVD